jgi:hypothetical protein
MIHMPSWTYSQKTGQLCDPDGNVIETGYAGAQPYVNQPSAEWREDLGPLPTGTYTIEAAFDHANLGPCSMPLTPSPANTMYGRSAFYIHGDTAEMNQTASTGCVIMSRATRDMIDASPIKQLKVVI